MEHIFQRKITFQDKTEGILRTDDGALFKIVDKEKKIYARPMIVFVYDIATLVMALMNAILWNSINKNLLDNSPFTNYVVNNIIVFICKFIVCVFGVVGIVNAYRKNQSKIFKLYSSVRLTETFLVGTIKFVYTIGLFNFAYQNNNDPTQSIDYNNFVVVMAVYNLFDCIVYLALNIYFCNQAWIGLNKKMALESVRNSQTIEMQAETSQLWSRVENFFKNWFLTQTLIKP